MEMTREDIMAVAEGLKKIEEGVEKIQSVMRSRNYKSIQQIAEELIPLFKKDDDSLSESVIRHLA